MNNLKKYNEKRDFTKTKEPVGKKKTSNNKKTDLYRLSSLYIREKNRDKKSLIYSLI